MQIEFNFSNCKIDQYSIVRDILDNSLRLGKINKLIYDAIIMTLNEEKEEKNGIQS